MALKGLTKSSILDAMRELSNQGMLEVTSSDLMPKTRASRATLKRYLDELVSSGEIVRTGKARSTRYRLSNQSIISATIAQPLYQMSADSLRLRAALTQPLASRMPVTYQRSFVDQYVPNETFLLSRNLAERLFAEGRMRGQQPAGTYARKVLEQLLIDLSWSSSKLEGNRFTLLATEELFKKGVEDEDGDAVMLLNHKRAIEFLVDAVPEYGLSEPIIRNLHSLLMQDLLADPEGLGEIRRKMVNIADTSYVPTQVPTLLKEMLAQIVEKTRRIKNPIEAAFFLWINIAYLQPFEDGNKRTSRLAANIPLMIYNCAPLSFMDVDAHEYAYAMMGVYELLDTSLACDLFAWTYRRSIQKYGTVLESLGGPDPFRLKYRSKLSDAVQWIVQDRQTIEAVVRELDLPTDDIEKFTFMLMNELALLSIHNCARHRVTMKMVEDWIREGRPQ